MYKVYLLGVAGNSLGPEAQGHVDRCETIFCSNRYRQIFEFGKKRIFSLTPLSEMLTRLEEELEMNDVALLASGDPLFFGIGRRLLEHFEEDKIEILPALSSMQMAAGRFKIPWDNAAFISLHGRGEPSDYCRLLNYAKSFVFTDNSNSPNVIARRLLTILTASEVDTITSPIIHVAENLGFPDERCVTGTLSQIAAMTFSGLNIMAILNPAVENCKRMPLGLVENEICHSRGLITKSEVRAATIHALRLPSEGVFWDIGAGSGSIAIEAARLCPGLRIFAVERNEEQLANIRENCRKFSVYNVEIVNNAAPEALLGLPDPDRVFIGGSGGKLEQIIKCASERLAADGRIIVNGVIEKTKSLAPKLLFEVGLAVTISEVSVSRYGYPFENEERINFNPISIMCGAK